MATNRYIQIHCIAFRGKFPVRSYKKKGKAVPLHAMEALGGRGDKLLLILDLGTRWE
jgi:hypothetical protein